MTAEELDKLVASVAPQRLRDLTPTCWGVFQYRGRTAIPVMALVEGLMAGLDTGEGAEKRRVMLRLRDAVIATVRQMPGAAHLPAG